jgi:hypothetical protein
MTNENNGHCLSVDRSLGGRNICFQLGKASAGPSPAMTSTLNLDSRIGAAGSIPISRGDARRTDAKSSAHFICNITFDSTVASTVAQTLRP